MQRSRGSLGLIETDEQTIERPQPLLRFLTQRLVRLKPYPGMVGEFFGGGATAVDDERLEVRYLQVQRLRLFARLSQQAFRSGERATHSPNR